MDKTSTLPKLTGSFLKRFSRHGKVKFGSLMGALKLVRTSSK